MRGFIKQFIGIVVLGVVLVIIVNILVGGPYKPNLDADPPIYPGAQEVKTQDLNPPEVDQDIGGLVSRIISFSTNSKPEAVLSFYNDALSKDGWHRIYGNSGGLVFIFGESTTFRSITVKGVSNTQSNVEVKLGGYPIR